MKILFFISYFIVFVFLTITTQTGGVIFLIALLLTYKVKKYRFWVRLLSFISLYLMINLFLTPVIAKQFGREKIKITETIQPRMLLTDLLNRNYVKAELNQVLAETAAKFQTQYPEIKILYLDGNFPFIDKFPLLPHLSHNDGKKLDLCFIYKNANGKITNNKPSRTGYGVFAMPTSQEENTNSFCKTKGYWQYDYTKYVTFGTKHKDLKLATKPTRELIFLLIKNPKIKKIFIEPHLKYRLKLNYDKMRFHGCQAVRHDDHIHIQL